MSDFLQGPYGYHDMLEKAAGDTLKITWRWGPDLTEMGDSLDSYTMSCSVGCLVESHSMSGTDITAFVSGGVPEVLEWVDCTIVTDQGQILTQRVWLRILPS